MGTNSNTTWTAIGALASVVGVAVAILAWQYPPREGAAVGASASVNSSDPSPTAIPSGASAPVASAGQSLPSQHQAMDFSTTIYHSGDIVRLGGESRDESWDFRYTPSGGTGPMMLQTSSAKTADVGDQAPTFKMCHTAEYSSEDVYVSRVLGKWMCVLDKDNAIFRMHVDEATDDDVTIHVEGWN